MNFSANLLQLAGKNLTQKDNAAEKILLQQAENETMRGEAQKFLSEALENRKAMHNMEVDLAVKTELRDQLDTQLRRLNVEIESERAYIKAAGNKLVTFLETDKQETDEESADEGPDFGELGMELLCKVAQQTSDNLSKVLKNIDKINSNMLKLNTKQADYLEHVQALQKLKDQRHQLTQELTLLERIAILHQVGIDMESKPSQSAFRRITKFFARPGGGRFSQTNVTETATGNVKAQVPATSAANAPRTSIPASAAANAPRVAVPGSTVGGGPKISIPGSAGKR